VKAKLANCLYLAVEEEEEKKKKDYGTSLRNDLSRSLPYSLPLSSFSLPLLAVTHVTTDSFPFPFTIYQRSAERSGSQAASMNSGTMRDVK
jgi:hypothetical protein